MTAIDFDAMSLKHLYYYSDVAEEVLNRCTIANPAYVNFDDLDICVVYDYEFIEDASTCNE